MKTLVAFLGILFGIPFTMIGGMLVIASIVDSNRDGGDFLLGLAVLTFGLIFAVPMGVHANRDWEEQEREYRSKL